MSWYLISTEGEREGLPAKCTLLEKAITKDGREAILVKSEKFISAYMNDVLLLVPKSKEDIITKSHKATDIVAVYIIDPKSTPSITENEILDLSEIRPIDWGAITFDENIARQWAL